MVNFLTINDYVFLSNFKIWINSFPEILGIYPSEYKFFLRIIKKRAPIRGVIWDDFSSPNAFLCLSPGIIEENFPPIIF